MNTAVICIISFISIHLYISILIISMNKEKLFQTDMEYRMYRFRHFAQKYCWTLTNDDGKTFEFINNEGSILKINYVDAFVETTLIHPKWGSTTLIRKGDFTQKIIESIFRNPRVHISVNNSILSSYTK